MSRYAAPMSSAMAETSPILPPILPKNASHVETSTMSFIEEATDAPVFTSLTLSFIVERIVAPVSISKYFQRLTIGSGQVVICAGNESSRNTRPAIAGLKILLPRPPNAILTIPMENIEPRITIYTGRFDGKLRASSTPVTIAE